jgi:hypothetical protein
MSNSIDKKEYLLNHIPDSIESTDLFPVTLPNQETLFQLYENNGSAKYISGSDILLNILKNNVDNDEVYSNIKNNLRSLQNEYDEIFFIRSNKQEMKTNVDLVIRLYELTDDNFNDDSLLLYASSLRENATTPDRQMIALTFERFVRFMFIKEQDKLDNLYN